MQFHSPLRLLRLAAGLALGLLPSAAFSQVAGNQGLVVRDGSLGAAPAGVVPPGIDPHGGPADYLIAPSLGEQRGGNLFHSFERFSIGTGETATFTGPDPIGGPQEVEHIVSRVTGGVGSDLDGTLRSTIPGADVYLLNPSGIVFGPNAHLDVQGSFHASTADRLEFENGEVFEARAGGAVPLLQVAAPQEFGFLSTNVAPIEVDRAHLATSNGASLSMIGAGEVAIGGLSSVSSSGNVSIRGGTVRVEADGILGGADILIESSGEVAIGGFVHSGRGELAIRGAAITLEGRVEAVDPEGGGSVRIEGRDEVTIAGEVAASSSIGDAGSIAVRGSTLEVRPGAWVHAVARSGTGNGGRIELEGNPVTVDWNSRIEVEASGSGQRGTITILGPLANDGLVVRDGSLGAAPAGVVAGGIDPLSGVAHYLIPSELGRRVGPNLFHSFERFSIGAGETATFTGPDPVEALQTVRSIVSRVTGGGASHIDGTLRSTVPGADVYLLNPAGVIFGSGIPLRGSRLDVGGSFHASTADRLEFSGGEVFEARAGGAAPQLVAASPGEFGFLGGNASPLVVEPGSVLLVTEGASLLLVGAGELSVGGHVWAPGGSLGDASRVALRGRTVTVEASGSVRADAFGTGNGGQIELEGDLLRIRGRLSARPAGSGLPGTISLRGALDVESQGLVVRDGSIGPAGAGVVRAGVDPLGVYAQYLITPELGRRVGPNLFHSFERFSIGTGETASFTGPDPVQGPQTVENIISRVTGGVGSEIDGTLRSAIPGADVYLLNPAGVVFGPGSRLVVAGSFHASTADRLEFSGGEVFEARAGGAAPMLAAASPEQFGFLVGNAAPLVVEPGSVFQVLEEGASLSLIGAGAVDLAGYLEVLSGHPTIPGDLTIRGGRVVLRESGSVYGGNVLIEGREDVTVGASTVSVGGNVLIEGGGDVTIRASVVSTSLTGPAGLVAIRGDTVRVEESGSLTANSFGSEDAGSVRIEGRGEVTVGGLVSADSFGNGNAGDVTVRGGTVSVDPSGAVTAAGFGDGGNLLIEGDARVTIGGLVSASSLGGSAGDVIVRGGAVSVVGSGAVTAAASDTLDGGSVLIASRGDTTIGGNVDVGSFVGKPGTITIRGDAVTVEELASVATDSFLEDGGRVRVEGGSDVTIRGLLSASSQDGNGGDVTISGDTVTVRTPGLVRAESDGALGGRIELVGNPLMIDEGTLSVSGPAPGTILLKHGLVVRLVVRDGSLGPVPGGVVVGGFDPLGRLADYLITPELGREVGPNLFHSFERFSIGTGETATFTGPDPIQGPQTVQNIISRVTGGTASRIDGTLRSMVPGAALYFLNPAGLVFGQGAQLDVGGSFHASTADRLEFGGGEVFEARFEGAVPALELSAPAGFGFLSGNTAPIGVEDALAVSNGASLSLIGAGEVAIGGQVSASSGEGKPGGVTIRGGSVRVEPSGSVTAESFGSADGGSVRIEGSGDVTIGGPLSVSSFGSGNAGDVTIRGGTLMVQQSGAIRAEASEIGNGGRIDLEGSPVTLDGTLSVEALGSGRQGTITVRGFSNDGLVARDGSLGPVPGGVVAGGFDPLGRLADYLITPELGRQVGPNLFHSFERFSIRTGETATFTGPDPVHGPQTVENIISRVTGGIGSEIDGTLRSTIPGAALYLLNPAGLVFGQGAQLDVPGSFHASTADRLEFDGGEGFEARFEGEVPALALGAPAGFGFLSSNTAPIAVERTLEVSDGASLSLVGAGEVGIRGFVSARSDGGNAGDVTIRGRSVVIEEGFVTAAAVDGNGGTISLEAEESILIARGAVSADSFSGSGGSIRLSAPDLEIVGSGISATSDTAGDAGSVVLDVGGSLVVSESGIYAYSYGGGDAGSVVLEVGDSIVLSESRLDATSFGGGDAGIVRVRSPEASMVLQDHSHVWAMSLPGPTFIPAARGGAITLEVASLVVEDASTLAVVSVLGGDAGEIAIEARDSVVISNEGGGPLDLRLSRIDQVVDFTAVAATSILSSGSAGTVSIQAPAITITDGATLSSSSLGGVASGEGGAGRVVLRGERIEISRGALVDASTSSFGAGGSVEISASDTVLVVGEDAAGIPSRVRSITVGVAEAGRVSVSAPRVEVDGGAIATSTLGTSPLVGSPAGDVEIDAGLLRVSGGGRIDSSSFGPGAGGDVIVRAGEIRVVGEGSAIATKAGGAGLGGNVDLRARTIEIAESGSVSSESTDGVGAARPIFEDLERSALMGFGFLDQIEAREALADAGSVSLAALDSILLSDGGSVTTRADRSDGGQIMIRAGQALHLTEAAEISASVQGGEGGSIEIDTLLALAEDSRIVASAAQSGGRGGRVGIRAGLFFERGDTLIDASAPGGPEFSGTVEIEAPDVDLAAALAALPGSFLDAASLMQERCAARRTGEAGGSFMVRRSGGVPAEPDGLLPAFLPFEARARASGAGPEAQFTSASGSATAARLFASCR